MDLALLQEKNLVDVWKQKEVRRRKSRKKIGPSLKDPKRRINNIDFSAIFLALINVLAKVILLVACFYGIFLSYRFATESPYFTVSEMNIAGQERLTDEELKTWIGPIIGRNIFQLKLNKISQRLADHPWVYSASIRRVFPQGIYVELKERTPFAKIQLERLYIMDNYGVLLEIEKKSVSELPTITGIKVENPKIGSNVADKEIINGLKMIHSFNQLPVFNKNPINNVHIKNRNRVVFNTQNKDIKIYIRPEIAEEGFKNLVLALSVIEKNEEALSFIDLSFKNKVIAKHKNKVKRDFL